MKELLRSKYSRLFLAGLVLFILAAIFTQGYNNPDEHFQVLEFCNYLLGKSSAGSLAWEFQAKIRPALQPYMAFVFIKAIGLIGINNPFIITELLRLLTGLVAWFIICRLSLLLLNDFTTEKGKTLFIVLNLFLWFIPYLSVRFSSENYCILTFLSALYLLLKHFKKPVKRPALLFITTGLLLGFSFFFRFQILFAIAGLGIWMAFVQKTKPKNLMLMACGGLLSAAFCVFLDSIFYGSFQFTPYTYFYVNLVQHRAAGFGVSPWWWYFQMFLTFFIPPFSIILLFFFAKGIYKSPKHIFTFCIIPFFLAHLLIGHKEIRFLFPILYPFIYFTAIGVDNLIHNKGFTRLLRYTYYAFIFINLPLLAFRTLAPAQEIVNCYWFIYNYNEEHKSTLLCKGQNPYESCNLTLNFYQSPGLSVVVLNSDKEIINYVHNNPSKRMLIFSDKLILATALNTLPSERIYSLFPEWVLKFNINNWESRTKVWSIYEIKNNSAAAISSKP